MALNRKQVTVMLGIAQTLSWASSYYLLAVLAKPISQSVGTSYSLVFGAFSAALLVAGLSTRFKPMKCLSALVVRRPPPSGQRALTSMTGVQAKHALSFPGISHEKKFRH